MRAGVTRVVFLQSLPPLSSLLTGACYDFEIRVLALSPAWVRRILKMYDGYVECFIRNEDVVRAVNHALDLSLGYDERAYEWQPGDLIVVAELRPRSKSATVDDLALALVDVRCAPPHP